MLKTSKVFSSFSTNNIEQTKTFYTDKLGVVVKDNPMGVIELHLEDGAHVMIYPKPNHEPASFTILNFIVGNITETVDELTAKGIVFEQYEGEIKTDEKGISWGNDKGPNIAWFKDSAGNNLVHY